MTRMSAAYQRDYYASRRERIRRKAVQEGVNDGVEMCCKLLRELIGERSVTGFEAAHAIAKTLGVNSAKTL